MPEPHKTLAGEADYAEPHMTFPPKETIQKTRMRCFASGG
jgi:hypothetical protein